MIDNDLVFLAALLLQRLALGFKVVHLPFQLSLGRAEAADLVLEGYPTCCQLGLQFSALDDSCLRSLPGLV